MRTANDLNPATDTHLTVPCGTVSAAGERASVIVVEHDMDFVRQLDAPVTVLHMGSVFTQGTFEELSGDDRVIDIYLGAHHGNGSPVDDHVSASNGPLDTSSEVANGTSSGRGPADADADA